MVHRYYFGGVFLFFALLSFPLEACSRVLWQNSINVMTARTMDLLADDKPLMKILPRGLQRKGDESSEGLSWVSRFGSVVLTAFDGESISEGMNEKGLTARVLCLGGTKYEPLTGEPKVRNGLWMQYILDNFPSVQEALPSLNNYQVISLPIGGEEWFLHACLEDASGDSALIEFINGQMVVYHGPEHQVLTNEPCYSDQQMNLKKYQGFGGFQPLPIGFHSEDRFVKLSALLQKIGEPKDSWEALQAIMQTIKQVIVTEDALDDFTSPTRWISFTDHTHLIYYFHSLLSGNFFWIDLKKIAFTPGKKVQVLYPHEKDLAKEIISLQL